MVDIGGLFNHLLFLQHLTNLLPKKILRKKKEKKRKSILRFANFKLITVCKISGDKKAYLYTVSHSFPMGAAWSLLCQHFILRELKPAGYCLFSKKVLK